MDSIRLQTGALQAHAPTSSASNARAAERAESDATLNRDGQPATAIATCAPAGAAAEEKVNALLRRLVPALERTRVPFDASFFVALVHCVRYAMCAPSHRFYLPMPMLQSV